MSKKSSASNINMTEGSPFKLILLFALPLIAGNALQQLYNMVDSIVVGRFVGYTALAAVGLSFPIIFMVSSLFIGLGTGAMVMVSQYFGAKDPENMRHTIDSVYTALMVGAIPLSLLGILITNPLLSLLNVPEDARREAFIYLAIVMGGLVGSLGYNLNAGLLQGVGDSRTPLLFLAIASGLNIVLDLFFVLVIPLGVAGVAIATIMAQAFSWLFGIVYINRHYPHLTIHPFGFKFNPKIFWQIVRIGLPVGIQQALFSVATLMLNKLVGSYGSAYLAGFSGANKLDTFAFLPIQSVATSVTTYTGQNIGAGRVDRVHAGTRAALGLSFSFAALGLLVIPAGPLLMRMFSPEAEVIASGMAYLIRIMPFFWLLSIMFILNSVMRGAGEAMVPLISTLLSMWLVRVPAAYLMTSWFGRDNMHFSYGIGWTLGVAISGLYYLSGRWLNKAVTRAGANPTSQKAP